MGHVPHELAEEFPDQSEQLHLLKISDPHAAKMFDDYHVINREIHRGETNVEPMDDLHMNELRKKRLALKDEIAVLLKH